MNGRTTYLPSYFLGMLCPKHTAPDTKHSYDHFLDIAKARPSLSTATKSSVVYLLYSRSTKIAVNHENQVTLILHGEIYNSAKENQAESLLEQFITHGIAFTKDINGSFAILLLDERDDTVALITDRINSRKVFCSKYKGNYWLSTSLYRHPTNDVDVDPVGIACYLANGVIHNNRTLFDGIQVLERACVHKLTKDGFHAIRYWSYEFSGASAAPNEADQSAELSDLLVESVKVRLSGLTTAFLSLSGGYDSTGVLGVLGSKLHFPDVQCFSYGLGEPKPSSDEYVARATARHLGFSHRILKSYRGKVVDVIAHNARLGQGLSVFCDEADAWIELANDFSTKETSVLFGGDESFGWTDCTLKSDFDVLDSVSIHDFTKLSWLSGVLPPNSYRTLRDGLREDLLEIVKRCPPTEDYHDSKDFLYLDQRLNNLILTWRECFAGRFVTVRNPWLDNSILDFMMRIPSLLRRGKRLYIKTITSMLPSVFQHKRALTSSCVPDWKREFSSQRLAIESLVASQDSKLDKIVPPELIFHLLEESQFSKRCKFCSAMLRTLAGRLPLGIIIGQRILNHFPNAWRSLRNTLGLDPTILLQRILVARTFLSKTSSLNSGP